MNFFNEKLIGIDAQHGTHTKPLQKLNHYKNKLSEKIFNTSHKICDFRKVIWFYEVMWKPFRRRQFRV